MSRLLATLLLAAAVTHAQGPAHVLVVVNDWSSASRAIGDYYVAQRRIPPANVCHIATGDRETVDRATYLREIEAPIAQCLRGRKLTEQVLYFVTTLGVPLRVSGPGTGMTSETAAVDSELTLLYGKLQGRAYPTAGPLENPFYRRRENPFEHRSFPIYLVTRLAAYTVEEAKALIDRSLRAENRGHFVLDMRDAEEDEGNSWLRTAALLLPKERVVLDESPAVLTHQKDVIAFASWGSNDKKRTQRFLNFSWRPGAIMIEYVSTNGRTFRQPPDSWTIGPWSDRGRYWYGAPQSLSADYLHEGASGAAGHVDEPFLYFCPRPDFVFPAYFAGRTLAESYYLGMPALSWMNIVIGDPLTRLGKAQPRRP